MHSAERLVMISHLFVGFCFMPARAHGKTESAEYRAWCHMKTRCLLKTVHNYASYGGRGIRVCERWLNSFENFYADMGPRPSKLHSLDRYPDKNGNYEPANCRWATAKEQARNLRTNKIIEYNGIMGPISEIAESFGINPFLIYSRLRKGWSVIDAIETPRDLNKIAKKYRKNE